MLYVKNMSFKVPFCTLFVQNGTSTVLKALLCNYEAARLNSYKKGNLAVKSNFGTSKFPFLILQ